MRPCGLQEFALRTSLLVFYLMPLELLDSKDNNFIIISVDV